MIEVKNVIRSLNAYARLLPATKARVDLQKIMNVQAFSLEKLALDPSVLEVAEEESTHGIETKEEQTLENFQEFPGF